MQLPQSDQVCIQKLSKIFEKKSESYKLFWFQAILNKVIDGNDCLTFDELINEMIADSWYMVTEYRLNLGPSDTLEALVHYIYNISGLKTSEKKSNIIAYLSTCKDRKVAEMKRTLTQEVPFRLQAPFLKQIKSHVWSGSKKKLTEEINREKRLIYYFSELSGIKTMIYLQPEWCSYMIENQCILNGWIQYNLIIYLQRRNPNVPGIAEKLDPPRSRNLTAVIKYWKKIVEIKPVCEIYSNEEITSRNISIDHFVPWSYVAHDEFWNLHPTTISINSRKGSNLPSWDKYFPMLCGMEYFSYQMMWEYDRIHDEFEKCKKIHVNSNDVLMRLYKEGLDRSEFYNNLDNILRPVYDAAQNAGFGMWEAVNN